MDAYSYLSFFFTQHKNHISITKMYLKQEDPSARGCPGSQPASRSCSSSVDQGMCSATFTQNNPYTAAAARCSGEQYNLFKFIWWFCYILATCVGSCHNLQFSQHIIAKYNLRRAVWFQLLFAGYHVGILQWGHKIRTGSPLAPFPGLPSSSCSDQHQNFTIPDLFKNV